MRAYHERVAADVRLTTTGSDTLLGFLWRGRHERVVRWLDVWVAGEVVHQRVATADGKEFELHIERCGAWILDMGPE